jgi:hypothetical protein
MKKETVAAVIAMAALAPMARADLYVFERLPAQEGGIHHGLANGVPVLIDIYGKRNVEAAQEYGKSLVGHHSFAESKQLIESKAGQLYGGKPAMIRWFEQDCAQAYDQQTRASR